MPDKKDVRRERAPASQTLLLRRQDLGYPQRHELDWPIFMARAQDGDADAYLRHLEEIVPYPRRQSRSAAEAAGIGEPCRKHLSWRSAAR